MKALLIKPGDMLETPGHVGPHLYHVAGVFLGAVNQEDVVELVPIDQTRPTKPETVHPLVPLGMIEVGVEAGIFTYTPRESLEG